MLVLWTRSPSQGTLERTSTRHTTAASSFILQPLPPPGSLENTMDPSSSKISTSALGLLSTGMIGTKIGSTLGMNIRNLAWQLLLSLLKEYAKSRFGCRSNNWLRPIKWRSGREPHPTSTYHFATWFCQKEDASPAASPNKRPLMNEDWPREDLRLSAPCSTMGYPNSIVLINVPMSSAPIVANSLSTNSVSNCRFAIPSILVPLRRRLMRSCFRWTLSSITLMQPFQ